MPHAVSRLDTLALTAWWTAAARACESARGDRLFDDGWAALLAGSYTVQAFQREIDEQGPGINDLHAIVTRYFDEFLLRVTGGGAIRQVVLLASGLDARAFRLPWAAGTRVFDVDQAHLVTYKKTRFTLTAATPACVWEPVGADLHGQWIEGLREAGFDPARPSAWLLEECLHFFEPASVVALLETITANAAPGSWLGFDVVNRDMLIAPTTRVWHEQMSAGGAPWLFTCDHPEEMLEPIGWSATVVQPGEAGADFGRRPYPLMPRPVPGTPRALLVTALRR